jgi:hypothetical protein
MTESLNVLLRRLQKNGDIDGMRVLSRVHWRTLAGFTPVFLLTGAIPNAFGAEFSSSVNPNEGWKLVSGSKDIALYSRPRAGSPLKEFKAIGGIDAPSAAVHAVIDDFENYPGFMPYTVECRLIKRETDSIVGYQRLSPKICEDRDYTLRVWKKSWPAADGFVYLDRWAPANELGPPEKKGVVRVTACEGGWLLEPDGANKTRATYSIYTDTRGAIPAFIVNRASQIGIGKLFAAVRKQVTNPKYAASQL